MNDTIRPRMYASHICSLSKREDRLKALMSVPKEWQDLVKKHVENYFERKKFSK